MMLLKSTRCHLLVYQGSIIILVVWRLLRGIVSIVMKEWDCVGVATWRDGPLLPAIFVVYAYSSSLLIIHKMLFLCVLLWRGEICLGGLSFVLISRFVCECGGWVGVWLHICNDFFYY